MGDATVMAAVGIIFMILMAGVKSTLWTAGGDVTKEKGAPVSVARPVQLIG